jgi:hypothetical protein
MPSQDEPQIEVGMAMADEDAASSAVMAILRDYVGKRPQVTPTTTLFGDLNIWGDDAAELLEKLHERFGLNLSEFDRHFLPEGYSCFQLLLLPLVLGARLWRRYIASGTPEEGETLIPVTVQQLVEAVRMKRWPGEWSWEGKGDAALL